MKPIKINSLEDLARAVAARKAVDSGAKPSAYRHFTNAEGDIVKTLPADIQAKLKAERTAPKRKGYIVPAKSNSDDFDAQAYGLAMQGGLT